MNTVMDHTIAVERRGYRAIERTAVQTTTARIVLVIDRIVCTTMTTDNRDFFLRQQEGYYFDKTSSTMYRSNGVHNNDNWRVVLSIAFCAQQ